MKRVLVLFSFFAAVSASNVSPVTHVVEQLVGFADSIEKEGRAEKEAWESYEVRVNSKGRILHTSERGGHAELMVLHAQAKTLQQKEHAFLQDATADVNVAISALMSTVDYLDETTKNEVLASVKALLIGKSFLAATNADVHLKGELVWKPAVASTNAEIEMKKHFALYKHAKDVMSGLPAENAFVKKTLSEALEHLKSGDQAYLKQTSMSSRLTNQEINAPIHRIGFEFSFRSLLRDFSFGGFFKTVTQLFIGGGSSHEKQQDILPGLRGAPDITGSALYNLRLASKKGFDVLKYDIYNQGVPKTPQMAKDIADQLIDAAGQTRHHFMKSMIDMVKGITSHAQGKHKDAGVPFTKASLSYNADASISSSKAAIGMSSSNIIDV